MGALNQQLLSPSQGQVCLQGNNFAQPPPPQINAITDNSTLFIIGTHFRVPVFLSISNACKS